jgi:hypothetical protein
MYCLTVPSTDSLKRTEPWAISRSAVTPGLLSHFTRGSGAAGELPRALGPDDYQGKAVGDFLQTIFDSYASQAGLQGKERGPDIRAEVAKVKASQGLEAFAGTQCKLKG